MAAPSQREDLVGTAITAAGSTEGSPTRIPAERYYSPAFAEREHEKLWPRVWQIACSLDHVSEPGDYFVYDVGRYSVLIVRGRDGELRAFQNVCQHRGNVLCVGRGQGLRNLRCAYHGWLYDLAGELKGVPSFRGFGEIDHEKLALPRVQVDSWGPLVFVNLDLDAMPLSAYLEGVPADIAWADIDAFRCSYTVTTPAPANWKMVADGYSETYHVQTLHREMLGSMDDIDAPQHIWGHHGVARSHYGVPSPRLGGRTDQEVWDSFIVTQGARIGVLEPCPVPEIPAGQSVQDVIATKLRELHGQRGADFSMFEDSDTLLLLNQYALFPNATVLVNAEILSVMTSRPGPTPDEAVLTLLHFDRQAPGAARSNPQDAELPFEQADFGFVLNQDVALLANAQKGVHQPGFTHLNLSSEEIRIINVHHNLERYLGIEPSEMSGGPTGSG